MKKTIKKLVIEREVVRTLGADGFAMVRGGTDTIPPNQPVPPDPGSGQPYPSGITYCITYMAGYCTVINTKDCRISQ